MEGLAVYSDEVQSTFLQELVRGMIRHPLERLEPWHKEHGGLAYAWFLQQSSPPQRPNEGIDAPTLT